MLFHFLYDVLSCEVLNRTKLLPLIFNWTIINSAGDTIFFFYFFSNQTFKIMSTLGTPLRVQFALAQSPIFWSQREG
jgi:hypothetical protein